MATEFEAVATSGFSKQVERVKETIKDGVAVTVSGASAGGLEVLGVTGAGLKYRIFKIFISSDTAEKVTFSDGIGVQYVVAGGNMPVDIYPVGILQTTANTAITATTTGVCNLSVTVVYRKE